MTVNVKKQQGSFFAEVGAVIASISILTLISTSYMDSMAGRAQVTEAFVLMQPLVEGVNKFYSQHGVIGNQGTGNANGNFDGKTVFDNSESLTNDPYDFAGRYVKEVVSYSNGVVSAQMNPQHNDATFDDQHVGKVSNVQTAVQGEYIILVPWLIGNTASGDASENTSLRWSCLTTIDANPPTGSTLGVYNAETFAAGGATNNDGVINEQYFYAPGCVVISIAQADCLDPDGDLNGDSTACANAAIHQAPINWNDEIGDLFTS
jgi:Tfp pilus assembly major pilin PilA